MPDTTSKIRQSAGTTETVRTIGISIIAWVALCTALFFGREFFVPIAFAIAFSVLLRPIVRAMERAKLPAPAGATIVVLAIVGICALGGWMLATPIQNWIEQAPERLKAAQGKLDRIRKPIQAATSAAQKLQAAASGGEPATSQPSTAPATQSIEGSETRHEQVTPTPAQPASVATPAVAGTLGTTATILSETVEVILMLYLLLAAGDLFLNKLVKIIPRIRDKAKAVGAIHDVERAVLQYVIATALINVGQAVVIGLALWWLGMPSPLLWGLGTFALEFIPYLGGAVMIAMLSITAFATFDNIGRILAVPGSYMLVTTLQNNIVSPIAYGKRLKLNPVAVLVGVMFWWFVWGVAGAFLAVPIVATGKIVCDRVDPLKPIGEFLGE
jgi:predicted PurR-regulated permease PerM